MPDRPPLDLDALRAALGGRWAAVDVVAETASTNADLLARRGVPDRTALAAEHQVAGRGRFDRTWVSPPRAGLTFSVLLRPDVPMLRWGWLPLLAGLALQEAVAATTDVAVTLKWPNDLLGPSGGKLAGLLAQTAEDAVVVGIGLNVSTTADELPVATATSLALEGATELDRTALLVSILRRLDARVAQWADCGGDAEACGIRAAYSAACATLGSRVRVPLAADAAEIVAVEGEAVDVDALGRLVVRDAGGDRLVSAGDVVHVRPV